MKTQKAKTQNQKVMTPEQAIAELRKKYPNDASIIDDKVIDVRQNKIAEKVDKINDLKQFKAEAPKAEAPKAEPKPKKEKGPTLAGVMDSVLAQGGTWDDLVKRTQEEATKVKLTGKVTKGIIASHFKFRQKSQEWAKALQATEEGITITAK